MSAHAGLTMARGRLTGRPRQIRPPRRHRLGRALRLGSGLLLLGGVGWCLAQAPLVLARSPRCRLEALEVSGHQVVAGREVLAASGLRSGDNLFAIDLDEVRRNIEKLPWVRSAYLRRRPPNRLVVRIVERRRAAWVDLGRIYGVDAEGVVLPGAPAAGEALAGLDLPVVSGLDCALDSLAAGATVPDSMLVAVLEWWAWLNAADPDFSHSVSEIQPMGPGAVRLLLVGDGLEVRLPRECVEARIRTLKELMKRVYRECPEPAYIDLRFAGQAVVGSKERDSS